MYERVGVEGPHPRYAPLIEESARILDPGGGKPSLANTQVLSDGGEKGVIALVPGWNGLGGDEVLAIVDRSTYDDFNAPKGKVSAPESSLTQRHLPIPRPTSAMFGR